MSIMAKEKEAAFQKQQEDNNKRKALEVEEKQLKDEEAKVSDSQFLNLWILKFIARPFTLLFPFFLTRSTMPWVHLNSNVDRKKVTSNEPENLEVERSNSWFLVSTTSQRKYLAFTS